MLNFLSLVFASLTLAFLIVNFIIDVKEGKVATATAGMSITYVLISLAMFIKVVIKYIAN